MVLQVGVKVLLKNNQGKYLLLKRSSKKYPDVEKLWDLPGGRIGEDEELLTGLRREVKEETGLELDQEFHLISAQDIFSEDKHVVRLTYWTNVEDPVVVLSDENEDFVWAGPLEITKMEGVDKYLQGVIEQIF